jgi:Fic family protein
MKEFIQWINSDEIVQLNPFVRASLAHYHFSLIHPFWDGNGRIARLIEAMALQSKGIAHVPRALSNYYYRNVDDYYIAFSKSIGLKTDVTPFVEFAAKAAVSSLSAIKDTIVGFIRKFSLRDFIAFGKKDGGLTQRQHDLLCLLLDNPAPFSLLYGSVSTQTARRDLKKLSEMNLILQDPDGRNYLNLRALN